MAGLKQDFLLRRVRRGFSLPELLVASAIGLMVMAAAASLFSAFSRGVSQSRSIVEVGARLRNAAWQLRQDLHGVTVPPTRWVRPEANAGYFEIMENGNPASASAAGDTDDVLMFTTMSLADPFSGRLRGTERFESPVAEVVWFCQPSGKTFNNGPLFNLHRRLLLVAATPGGGPFVIAAVPDSQTVTAPIDRSLDDLSFRGSGTANSLANLSTAANRFWNVAGVTKSLTGTREGEDIILADVLSFDVQAFDAGANTYVNASYTTVFTSSGTPPAEPALRGLQITIRCVEPVSGQVRQVTVVHTLVR
jgi:prepilin-type N-terminal cleavage/methylation domain-containing protein